MIKYIFLSIFFTYAAVAGLPPTTTQGSAGGGYKTTFQFNFPNNPITYSGTNATLGALITAGIGNNQVTLGKLAQISNGTILSNISGSTADPAANSLSAIIDSAACATQGAVLYRNGSGAWVCLTPGTSGNFLQTQGAAANPQWAAAGSSTKYLFKGTHGTTCAFNRTSATMGDPSPDVSGTCIFSSLVNRNFGTVISYLSGSDPRSGLTLSFPDSSICYYVKAGFNTLTNGSVLTTQFQLTDSNGSPVVIDTGAEGVPTGTVARRGVELAGIYCPANTSPITIKIVDLISTGSDTVTISGTTNLNAIEWDIFSIN